MQIEAITTKVRHQELLRRWHQNYVTAEKLGKEFTWDGPSDWRLWEEQKLKIMFLVKEARNGFHPCVPMQPTTSKFARNLDRWKYLIRRSYAHPGQVIEFPSAQLLSSCHDDITIVEVKKLNEEKRSSNSAEILSYAKADQPLLREQIELINPHIVVCCNTFECYDVIYQNNYVVEEQLIKVGKCSCWNVDGRLVIDFYHPSTFPSWTVVNKKDQTYFQLLASMLQDGSVFKSFSW